MNIIMMTTAIIIMVMMSRNLRIKQGQLGAARPNFMVMLGRSLINAA